MAVLVARQKRGPHQVDTDAHLPEQLAFVELGLAAALQAHIPAERIVNFMPVDELIAWARRPAKG